LLPKLEEDCVDTDPWVEVLRNALARCGDGPVLGSRFRNLVGEEAVRLGMQFPPESDPTLRFADLIQRYPQVVTALVRPGQDLLIAPTDRPEILAGEQTTGGLVGLRPDLFAALTKINPSRHPWYDPEQDVVVWLETDSHGETALIPFPKASLENELAVRREFVELEEDTRSTALLREALESPQPLQAFTAIVRAEQLQRRWHEFRTQALIERLQKWSTEFGLIWNERWLTSGARTRTVDRTPHHKRGAGNSETVLRSLLALEPSDLGRISVPLDIVLRIVGQL
jgi:hypothetical protein